MSPRPPSSRRSPLGLVGVAVALAVASPGAARAQAPDPDAYDPLLDRPRAQTPQRRVADARPGAPGFFIGGGGFLYMGRTRSRLEKSLSTLENGAFPGVMLTLGGRARIPLEIGFDIGYGIGRRWNTDIEDWLWAHDLLLEPRALWHWHETPTWDFVGGLAGSVWMFDVGGDGISQTLIGPFGVLGVRRHLDARSLLFLELSGSLTWPRESKLERREANPGVGLGFEMYFGPVPDEELR